MTGLDKARRARHVPERKTLVAPPPGINMTNVPKERAKTKRVEIDASEYQLLRRIAGLTISFYPVLEQTAAPVTRYKEFEELRRALENYVTARTVTTTETETVIGLADLVRDLDAAG